MGKLLDKLNKCLTDLDDINDELEELGIDTTELLKGIDIIWSFIKKN